MAKKSKRVLSVLLTLVMIVGLLPTSVLAVDEQVPAEVVYEGGETISTDGLVTASKTIKHTGENNFEITLEVITKDQVTTTPAEDAHVVLVIDRSNSMAGDRIKKAREATEQFADIALGEGAADGNQIAVVSYSWNYENRIGLSGDLSQVKTAIGEVTTGGSEGNGGTNIQAGIHRAQKILDADTSDAKKVILVLSDGEPTYSYQATGTGSWDGCWKGPIGNHYWGLGSAKNVQFTGFNYNEVTGSGSSYRLDGGAAIDVTCEHGESKTVSGEIFSNNGQPAIKEAEFAKDAGTEIYSVFLGESGEANAVNTMKGVASGEDHYKLASDVDDLAGIFKGIAGSITTPTDAGIVEDPMGQFIVLGDVSDLAEQGVTKTSTGLEWNVSKAPYKENSDGSKTYTITYPITLNTSAEGFTDEGIYKTNGTTTFRYKVGGDDRSVTFAEPAVKGYIPTVPYTIEYYKWDTETEAYPEEPTDSTSDTAKMWETVNAPSNYANKYGENYSFVEGSTSMVLSSKESNVLKLYYKPIPATVIVNHYVSTVTPTDDGDVYSKPELRNSKEYENQYKGDEFSVPEADFLDSETYTLVEFLTDKNGATYETGDYTDVTLPAGITIINIYYTTEGESQRTKVPYEIHYWYREDYWQLNADGKYEVVTDSYEEDTTKRIESWNYHGETIPAPNKSGTDYTLDEDMTKATSMTLDKGATENRLDIYYYKGAPDAPDTQTATLTIVHHYFEKVVDENGKDTEKLNLVDTKYELGNADGGETVYVGETYTASVWPYDYTLQTPAADQKAKITEAGKHYTITMEYVKDTREPVDIVINHYYTTYTWTVDPETGDGEYVETDSKEILGVPATGIHYVDEKFTPTQRPNGYEYVSGGDEKILEAGTNTFDLYYETKIGGEDDEADVTINHIYRTYRSYVDEDGNVILKEPGLIKEESEKTYYGTKGETITAEKKEKDNFTFVSADTEDLKVTLRGENGQYNLYYEYVDNQLGEQVPVMVQPVYKTYTTHVNAEGKVVTELTNTENVEQAKLGDFYVGQKATALAANYGKTGFTYDASDEQNKGGLTLKVDADCTKNVITIVYSRTVDECGLPIVVLVNNVYTTLTTYIDADGKLQTSESSFTSGNTTYGPYYMGQYFDTTGKGTQLSGYELDTREGITQPAASVKVTQEGQLVTFYWLQEVNHTVPATVKVVHHYTLKDRNPNVGTSSWVVGADDEPLTGYFAGQYYLPGYNFQGGSFSVEDVIDVVPSGATTDPGVKLVAGLNEIHIYYEKSVDSRVPSSVKVIHNYYKDTDTMAAGTTEASYEENIPAMEADKFTATLRLENGSLYYEFVSANPETYTVVVDDDAANNVITINYVRAEATYTVVHEYYSNGNFRGSVTNTYSGKAGDTISADDIDKLTEYDGRNYTYRSADPEAMVLAADGENVMTLRYTRSSGGGGGSTDPKPDPDPDPDPDPGTDIEEPDVPTTELPEEPTDPAEPVEEPTEIEEPEVPMAEVPETGDSNFAYMHLLSLASAMGLAALFISDKRSKKHRDEN